MGHPVASLRETIKNLLSPFHPFPTLFKLMILFTRFIMTAETCRLTWNFSTVVSYNSDTIMTTFYLSFDLSFFRITSNQREAFFNWQLRLTSIFLCVSILFNSLIKTKIQIECRFYCIDIIAFHCNNYTRWYFKHRKLIVLGFLKCCLLFYATKIYGNVEKFQVFLKLLNQKKNLESKTVFSHSVQCSPLYIFTL